jgi:F0F1-type ATP synthase membrane subunit b/b'
MKALLTEKEAASKKEDALGQKYKKISVSLQSARASVREANSKKRKVEACLKSSLKKTQSNLTKAQEKSTAAINRLEKQNEDKLSQCNASHQCDLESQKVIILVSLFIS